MATISFSDEAKIVECCGKRWVTISKAIFQERKISNQQFLGFNVSTLTKKDAGEIPEWYRNLRVIDPESSLANF